MGDLFGELKRIYPEIESKACRKIGHVTRRSAEAQMGDILRSPDCREPDTLYVYRCANCGQFHVGHETRGDVRDESGRVVAPAQTLPVERPRGPWESNKKKE